MPHGLPRQKPPCMTAARGRHNSPAQKIKSSISFRLRPRLASESGNFDLADTEAQRWKLDTNSLTAFLERAVGHSARLSLAAFFCRVDVQLALSSECPLNCRVSARQNSRRPARLALQPQQHHQRITTSRPRRVHHFHRYRIRKGGQPYPAKCCGA